MTSSDGDSRRRRRRDVIAPISVTCYNGRCSACTGAALLVVGLAAAALNGLSLAIGESYAVVGHGFWCGATVSTHSLFVSSVTGCRFFWDGSHTPYWQARRQFEFKLSTASSHCRSNSELTEIGCPHSQLIEVGCCSPQSCPQLTCDHQIWHYLEENQIIMQSIDNREWENDHSYRLKRFLLQPCS